MNNLSFISLIPSNNIDDSVELCNGVGLCDFTSGRCKCPYVCFKNCLPIITNILSIFCRDMVQMRY